MTGTVVLVGISVALAVMIILAIYGKRRIDQKAPGWYYEDPRWSKDSKE